MKKILIHSCCSDCSIYAAHKLLEDFEVAVFYYNPNIHPKSEYQKRFNNLKKSLHKKVKLIEGKYDVKRWDKFAKEFKNEPERGARCDVCYLLRLEEAFKTAKKKKFDYVATTLVMGPQKKTEELFKIGKQLAKKYGVKFYDVDLKKEVWDEYFFVVVEAVRFI